MDKQNILIRDLLLLINKYANNETSSICRHSVSLDILNILHKHNLLDDSYVRKLTNSLCNCNDIKTIELINKLL